MSHATRYGSAGYPRLGTVPVWRPNARLTSHAIVVCIGGEVFLSGAGPTPTQRSCQRSTNPPFEAVRVCQTSTRAVPSPTSVNPVLPSIPKPCLAASPQR
jgi:hypothetical protein